MNNKYFHKIDTEEKAYWLGFILGDGYLYSDCSRLDIELKSLDSNHLIKFAKALGIISDLYYKPNQTSVRIHITDEQLYNDLLKLGLAPKKSFTARWPKIPKRYEIHMLRGLFDADGCISAYHHPYDYATFSLVGTKNCLKHVSRTLGITCKIYPERTIFQIHKCGNPSVHKIYDQLYKNATVWLNRKKEKFEELLKIDAVTS